MVYMITPQLLAVSFGASLLLADSSNGGCLIRGIRTTANYVQWGELCDRLFDLPWGRL